MLRDAMGRTFRLLGYTIQYGCIAHCAFEYLGGIVVCSGPSMEPTIYNSDIVFSDNLSCHLYSIQKGDIVIAKNPNDPKSNICKRVIGLEGDKVCTSGPSDFIKMHSYTDNMMAKARINRQGSRTLLVHQEAVKTLKWAEKNLHSIQAKHLSEVVNT
uniref:IMP1 inner mitochondrial membrane peptidase-like n=1 Tax=Sphaerodactylus townsendi TaxID=933632 RepID=A0ACB8G3W9_9SAUR